MNLGLRELLRNLAGDQGTEALAKCVCLWVLNIETHATKNLLEKFRIMDTPESCSLSSRRANAKTILLLCLGLVRKRGTGGRGCGEGEGVLHREHMR